MRKLVPKGAIIIITTCEKRENEFPSGSNHELWGLRESEGQGADALAGSGSQWLLLEPVVLPRVWDGEHHWVPRWIFRVWDGEHHGVPGLVGRPSTEQHQIAEGESNCPLLKKKTPLGSAVSITSDDITFLL